MVAYRGPEWWVKIADFGISKRAREGHTALRTLIGTPSFTAPEILFSFLQSDHQNDDVYTDAVDIWSLSVIAFLILTGETLFKDQSRLFQYVSGKYEFPLAILLANKISGHGCEFVKSLMAPNSEDRPGAKECLQHRWLGSLMGATGPEFQRYLLIQMKLTESSVYTS